MISKYTLTYTTNFFLTLLLLLFSLGAFSPLEAMAQQSCSNDISYGGVLRFPMDGVWRITQGYNCTGSGCTHILYANGFDLRHALDFGELAYNTANQPVFAPGDGTIVNGGGSTGYDEILCLDLDNGLGSIEIGHLETRSPSIPIPPIGTHVSRNETIGQLLSTGSSISSAPHLHIAYYDNDSCRSTAVPFNDLFGFDLSSNGDYNQYGPQWNGYTTEHQTVGCGDTPDPAAQLPGSNVLTNSYYNTYYNNYTAVDIEDYIAQFDFDFNISDTTIAPNPVEDDSLTAVIVRLMKEGVKFGPWLIALMIIITGFLFLTSMGITSRLVRAKNAFKFVLIGATVVFIAAGIVEIMESTIVAAVMKHLA